MIDCQSINNSCVNLVLSNNRLVLFATSWFINHHITLLLSVWAVIFHSQIKWIIIRPTLVLKTLNTEWLADVNLIMTQLIFLDNYLLLIVSHHLTTQEWTWFLLTSQDKRKKITSTLFWPYNYPFDILNP